MAIKTPIERFWAFVDKKGKDDCWEWLGGKDAYGRFWYDGKTGLAHRFAYQEFIKPIQDGCEVCHSCDNAYCVNPNHLFQGTHQDNAKDMVRKGRSLTGENHNLAKLTLESISQIRMSYTGARGELPKLAKKYGVTPQNIFCIVKGITWK